MICATQYIRIMLSTMLPLNHYSNFFTNKKASSFLFPNLLFMEDNFTFHQESFLDSALF